MRVDAHVASRAAQAFPFPVRDVLTSLWVSVLLGHTEIYYAGDGWVRGAFVSGYKVDILDS